MAVDSLEQQALDRVARMYSSYDRRQSRQAEPPDPKGEPPKPPEPPRESAAPAEKPKISSASPAGLLDALMEDKEQSLIMLLLIILMKDGADLSAVLALMYIII